MPPPKDVADNGSWAFAEELFQRGDPRFVQELRRITDAERLGNFARRWLADRRPEAGRLLYDYLDLPLNAYRHEALVKRLFKLAEAAGDDGVVASFLVMFDRAIRRVRGKRRQSRSVTFETQQQAADFLEQCKPRAEWSWMQQMNLFGADGRPRPAWKVHYTTGHDWLYLPANTTVLRPIRTVRGRKLPFGAAATELQKWVKTGPSPIDDRFRARLEKRRLFSPQTRRYLRRRAWRYFRLLAKKDSKRYLDAAVLALSRYRDSDVSDGIALLDNWGLIHLLFHHSPVLQAEIRGWTLTPGRRLGELDAAPYREDIWTAAPRALLGLVVGAQCRPVRQWAIGLLRRDHASVLRDLSSAELLKLLGHADPVVVRLAADLLRGHPDLATVGVDGLLRLLDNPEPETMEILVDLLGSSLGADRITLGQAVDLARRPPLPAAQLGFNWLKTKSVTTAEDCRLVLGLVDAEAVPLRPEMIRWMRQTLGTSVHFQVDWVLELLDCRHADVRAAGWKWMSEEPRASGDVGLWQKLLESPYDDVRLPLIDALQERTTKQSADLKVPGALDAGNMRLLWATVLLNIHRGSRSKPAVLDQLVRRLERHPDEAPLLFPILAVALRSLRGPEWRAGLAGLVRLLERQIALQPLASTAFPELQW